MKKFTCVADIGDLTTAVAEAMEIKRELLHLLLREKEGTA